MGIFYTDIEVASVDNRKPPRRIKKVMVDTGAEATWLPEDDLKAGGICVRKKDVTFLMANGQPITRDIGYAIIRCEKFETVDEVVFGKPGDLRLLGARTLEGFNAIPDPRRKKLIASGPQPAA
jgi:predicted aspartyl protease